MDTLINKKFKIQTKNKITTLTDSNYKASVGFETVFCLDSIAYKIYHDSKNMISKTKIHELPDLNRGDILSPIKPLYNIRKNIPIGFTINEI